jgi:outer membrane protein assembly factor BamE (lipoprotein component of BamABCDE complex)
MNALFPSRALAVLLAGTLVAGCAGYREKRGYIADPQLTASIQPGVDNKASVEKTLGRPTFTGEFDQSIWYYVSRSTSTYAFRKPRVMDQTVMRVKFDAAGNVAAIDRTGRELVVNVNPYGKQTPTLGRRSSFFDDIFGNIGVVNGAGGPAAQGNGRP